MAESLLNKILNGKVTLKALFRWLPKSLDAEQQNIPDGSELFGCTQGEFVSHFLNYIHEEAPSFEKFNETPRKVHTPKSIRKLQLSCGEAKIKRRPALFPDAKENGSPSTPDTSKSHLSELNCSRYESPVSPLYAKCHNNNTPKARGCLSLGDFIVTSSSARKKKEQKCGAENVEPHSEIEAKKSRRINPTNLSRRFSGATFGGSENTYTFTNSTAEASADRHILAEERLKVANRRASDVVVPTLKSSTPRIEVRPDLNLATYIRQLDYLVNVYSYLLSNNYVLNVVSELYFVLTLALSKHFETDGSISLSDMSLDGDRDEVAPKRLFNNFHNTVYFALKVLERHVDLLKLLDKTALKLLCSNERLETLWRSLRDETSRRTESVHVEDDDADDFQVCFVSDTDNRENFPCDASFHAFRKQRDLFYEILQIWEQRHTAEEWNFSVALGGKIRTLLGLYPDAANFRHFCRLFKAQLLSTCTKNQEDEVIFDSQLSFLSSIPVNSEKLNRLRNRLVTKAPSNGINAVPTFSGRQEFFKEFIATASMHIFNAHLKDAFIQEIVELNDSKFSKNELEERDSTVDLQTKKSYVLCIKSLRVLAKFLGYLESLPYRQSNLNISEKILSVEVKARMWEQPPFDLKQILTDSVRQGSLLLTIPWLTKYLSMLDYVTLRLAYYESLHEALFDIYFDVSTKHLPQHNELLLQFCLGWLFELPHFPSELYFIWCSRKLSGGLQSLDRGGAQGLDALEIVDKDCIVACCPYLEEFKKLLQTNCSKNGAISFKHITPVTASESSAQLNEKRLKLQLEEAFLNSHPISMRKTIEFVSERVASACVKNICNNVVPQAKADAVESLKSLLGTYRRNVEITTRFETEVKSKCKDLLQDRLAVLKDSCVKELEAQVGEKISPAVQLLLADEEMQQTKTTCCVIAARMCRDRIQQWINMHVNDAVFSKQFDMELTRFLNGDDPKEVKNKSSFALPTTGRDVDHNPETKSPAKMAEEIQNACVELVENSLQITQPLIERLLEDAEACTRQRCDVNDGIGTLLNKMMLDLLVLLITHRTDICDRSIMIKFVRFWQCDGSDRTGIFRNVVCPRNVHIINQAKRTSSSWYSFTDFIGLLFEHNLLDCEEFESQCVSIYRHNWDSVVLKQLSNCFQGVVENYRRLNGSNNARFTFLLSYLSDFCCDMDLDF